MLTAAASSFAHTVPHTCGHTSIACVYSQVLSLVDYPDLLKNKTALCAYPDDAVARAKAYIAGIPGGTGA